MTSQTLYRKYRPQKFSDVIGQEHILNVLKGALEKKNTSHAYLFAGPRGTGKTSIARIFAEALGCNPVDLYEIDAASNRGIDEIRELREGVRVLPFQSPVKVYLIDEVHMLTKDAANALLKTLEEPPAHAVFLLATTEPQKLPETVISRCQTFSFKKPTEEVLGKSVEKVAREEGYALAKDAAALIALLSEGSFRDAFGILQKVIGAAKGKAISHEDVRAVTGAPSRELVENFLSGLLDVDAARALGALHTATEQEADMRTFLKLVFRDLRRALLLALAPEVGKRACEGASAEELKFLDGLRAGERGKRLSASLRELLAAYEQIEVAYLPELPLELAVERIVVQK